jgi:hypothetical protein
MTDPDRLIEADDVGADLLASARSDGPSNRARARAAAMLGVGVGIAAATAGGTASASAGAGAGASAAAKVGGAGLLTKIIGGTLIVAAVGGGTAVAVRESSQPSVPIAIATTAVAPQVAAAPAPSAAEPAIVVNEEPAPAAEPVVEANALPSAPVAKAPPKSNAASPPPPAQESALTRELHSLDAAKARLEAHDANGAIAALDRHDREFPNGSLRAESAMMRIEALLARGDEAGAKARAKDLLAKDPNGPHAKRLRTILDR